MTDEKIRVRAGKGRVVYFPLSVIAAPGRRTLVLQGDRVIEVPANMRFVRRSRRNRDLVVVQTEGKAEPVPEIISEPVPDLEPDLDVAEED